MNRLFRKTPSPRSPCYAEQSILAGPEVGEWRLPAEPFHHHLASKLKVMEAKPLKTQAGHKHRPRSFVRRHGLSLVASSILLLWVVLYSHSDEKRHLGSFFGNAIADWTGVVVMVLATKHLYERGSQESKRPDGSFANRTVEVLREHSLTIFLVLTGLGWVAAFVVMDSQSKWGQVVGNLVSEWTQLLGMVLMTKKLMESGSKESSG